MTVFVLLKPPSQLVKVNDYVHGEKAQGSNE